MVAVDYCGESATDFEAWLTRHEPTLTPPQREALRCAHRLGNPYTAPSARGLAVVKLLTELKLDVPCLQAALAWEALQGGASSAEVGEVLGEIPATLLADSERLEQVVDLYHRGHHSAYQLENLRKMALAVTRDVRSVLIKLAQRLVEMRHLDSRPLEEQKALALEVRDLFAPLANRLGIGLIKWELEDLAMRHLEPQIYRRLAHALQERRSEREAYLKDALGQLRSALQKAGIDAEVSGRIKHLYSIWRKMRRKSLSFEQLFDIRALRIMVASIGDCYAALGVVHSIWSPVAREFDDYIAHPKGNGYQSLHTAVVGPLGKTVEVQIRTLAMHRSAEYGVAAHWRYKEDGAVDDAVEREVEELRQTLSGGDSHGEQGEAEVSPGGAGVAFNDRVYVITPKHTVVDLPRGATPLDFAYHIHTELGHRCRGAKINGRIAPLTYALENGDRVDVLTTKNGTPSRDWLAADHRYLKTSRARAKVRQWFKQQTHDDHALAGRTDLERELQRLGLAGQSGELLKHLNHFNCQRLEDLHAAIGAGAVTVAQVVARLQPAVDTPPDELPVKRRASPTEGAFVVKGVGNLLTQMANCCKPVPLDPIVGFITVGRGVSIHRLDCANAKALAQNHPERMIEVAWGAAQGGHAVDLVIEALDRTGLLRDIASVIANEKGNVIAAQTRSNPATGTAHMTLTVEIDDLDQLERLLIKLDQLPSVVEARRKG